MGLQHLTAKRRKGVRHNLTHFSAVLYDKNDGMALRHHLLDPSFRLFDRGVAEGARKVEPNGGAVSNFAIDLEVPARLLGTAVDPAEDEAGPFAVLQIGRASCRGRVCKSV